MFSDHDTSSDTRAMLAAIELPSQAAARDAVRLAREAEGAESVTRAILALAAEVRALRHAITEGGLS